MNYPTEFLQLLRERSGNRCECERSECHRTPGRCRETLSDEPGPSRWSPVMTGDHYTFPPVPMNYIALCGFCAVPRAGARPH